MMVFIIIYDVFILDNDVIYHHIQFVYIECGDDSVAQHFLLSARARTLSLKAVARMSDEEAREAFQKSGGWITTVNRTARNAGVLWFTNARRKRDGSVF